MSTYPTGGWRWTQAPVYIEEATPGTCPTNPATVWIGTIQDFNVSQSADATPVAQSASTAMREVLAGPKTYDVSITWIPYDSTFMKYGVNIPVGAGTIAKTLSILGKITMGSATAEYFAATYCVPKKLSMKWSHGKPVTCTMDLAAKSKETTGLFSTVNPIGTGSWAATAATASISFDSGGLTPFLLGAITPNMLDFTCDVDWGTKSLSGGGNTEPWSNQYTQQSVTGSFSCYWEDLGNLTAFHAQTEQTLVWTLITAGAALTITGTHLTKAGPDIKVGDVVVEKYSFIAETAALT